MDIRHIENTVDLESVKKFVSANEDKIHYDELVKALESITDPHEISETYHVKNNTHVLQAILLATQNDVVMGVSLVSVYEEDKGEQFLINCLNCCANEETTVQLLQHVFGYADKYGYDMVHEASKNHENIFNLFLHESSAEVLQEGDNGYVFYREADTSNIFGDLEKEINTISDFWDDTEDTIDGSSKDDMKTIDFWLNNRTGVCQALSLLLSTYNDDTVIVKPDDAAEHLSNLAHLHHTLNERQLVEFAVHTAVSFKESFEE